MKIIGTNKRTVLTVAARSNFIAYYISLYYHRCHPDKETNKTVSAKVTIKDYAGVTVNIYHKSDDPIVMAKQDGSIADLPPWPTPAEIQRPIPPEELEELPTVPFDPIPSELVLLESPFENSVVPDDEYALREWMLDDLVNSVPTSNEDVFLSEFSAWEENCDHVIYAVQKLQQQQTSTRFTPAYAASACNDYSFREIERPDSLRSVHSAPSTLERHPFREIAQGSSFHGQDVGQPGTNRDEQTVFNMKRQSTGWFHHLMGTKNELLPGFHAGTIARLGVGPYAGLHVHPEISVGQCSQPQMHFQFLIRNRAKPEKFTELIIPLTTILDTISINDISAEDAKSMATLYAFEPMELSHQGNGSDVLSQQLKGACTFPLRLARLPLSYPPILDAILTCQATMTRHDKMIRAKVALKNYTSFQANIYYKPDATTVIAECDAITAMNSRTEAANKPLAVRLGNHSTAFTSSPIMLNFLEKFPVLARAYREGQFDGEVQCLVEALRSVPFGWAFITGGPGSGKTTTVMRIVAAAVSGPVEMCKIPDTDEAGDGAKDGPAAPQQGNSEHLGPEDAEREGVSTVYSYHPDDSQQENFEVEFCEQPNYEDVKPKYIEPEPDSESDDSFLSFEQDDDPSSIEHGKSSDNLPAGQHPVATACNTTEPNLPTAVWETTDGGLVVAPVTKYDDPPALVYQTAPGFKYEADDTDIVILDESATAKAVWTAGQNKLAHDAILRAAKARPGKIVARILPWKREFANLLREGEAKTRVAAPANFALARHNEALTARKFDEIHLKLCTR
ncbi:hypothetical protein ACHAPJ_005349 [Fusarium lateritium]